MLFRSTWNEYASVRSDKEAFRLTHYSSLFNSAHCRIEIKGMDFILGWDDRYTTKEWNNQVNQMKKEHLKDFVEIDAQVAEEIKVVLQNYKDELVVCQAHLSTGLVGYEYNSAISKKAHLEKMIKIYSRMVDLLPTFEITESDIITAQNNLTVNEYNRDITEDFYKKRILTAKCDLLRAILNNLNLLLCNKESTVNSCPPIVLVHPHERMLSHGTVEYWKSMYITHRDRKSVV